MSENIPAIISQAEALGFMGVTAAKLIPGRWLRFRVEGHTQRDAGRIWLAEHTLANGRRVYVGSIGVYHGAEFVREKIDISADKDSYGSTSDDRKAIRAAIKKQQAISDAIEKAAAQDAAIKAERWFHALRDIPVESAGYLQSKRVKAYDVRATKRGSLVVPIRVDGRITALQFITSRKIKDLNKFILPKGAQKKGGYHWIGGIPRPGDIIVIAEGYATAATVHQATGLITVMAVDAGNIGAVVDALLMKWPDARVVIAADDDDLKQCPSKECNHRFMLSVVDDGNCPQCGQPHRRKNGGRDAALKACADTRVNYLLPLWGDKARRSHAWVKLGQKRNDFNDLMIDEGVSAVRLIFERYMADLRLRLPSHAPPVMALPEPDDDKKIQYIVKDLPTALWRFVLIADGGDSVFDMLLQKIIKMSDARNQFLTRDLYRRWQEASEPEKRVITMDDIGLYFDDRDRNKPGNMWRGFATKPIQNDDLVQELVNFTLRVICGGNETYSHFLTCCLAYPVQHLGDRPMVGIILNSDEGFGKGSFASLALRPWGEYGIVFDQEALEDRFNAQKENKIITIFEEIGAASGMDRHKLKNLMKHAVDGKTQRINPKQVNARNVKNYSVSFFLTNELLPFLLGNQGRRWFVLRLKIKESKEYYRKINEIIESEAGGNAWHHYLANYPLGDFHPYTDPPDTPEKQEMVELSRDPPLMFWHELMAGDVIEGGDDNRLFRSPILNADLYTLFEVWAKKSGIKWIPTIQSFIPHIKHLDGVESKRASYTLTHTVTVYDDNNHPYQQVVTDTIKSKPFTLPRNCIELLPEGKGLAKQLGECVLDFRAAVRQYVGKK